MIGLTLMGNTIVNSFDSDPAFNTSTIYLSAYVISRLVLVISRFAVVVFFQRRFLHSVIPIELTSVIGVALFVPVIFLPPDGTRERDVQRVTIWWIANVYEQVAPTFGIMIMRWVTNNVRDRPGVNIEHMVERNGSFFVITLGEVVISFLYNHHINSVNSTIGLTVLALLIGLNLSFLYFRAEGSSHYQHAMRRHWLSGIAWGSK
eukprot:jgi/Hompol1/2646/HPOL_006096-RA